jgi:hypothetical protein
MASSPEGRVKQSIKKLLDRLGVWYFMPVAGPFAVHGIPDFICCWGGDFIAIEAKAPGKLSNLTVHQQRKIEQINGAGGFAVAVDDAQELERLLTDWRQQRGGIRC